MLLSKGIIQLMSNFVICVCICFLIRKNPAHDIRYFVLVGMLMASILVLVYKSIRFTDKD